MFPRFNFFIPIFFSYFQISLRLTAYKTSENMNVNLFREIIDYFTKPLPVQYPICCNNIMWNGVPACTLPPPSSSFFHFFFFCLSNFSITQVVIPTPYFSSGEALSYLHPYMPQIYQYGIFAIRSYRSWLVNIFLNDLKVGLLEVLFKGLFLLKFSFKKLNGYSEC